MKSARILIADDQQILRWMVRTDLTRRGFDVVEAADGQEALEKVASDSPDLLVLDVMMPRMDGFEVLEQVKQVPGTRDIPVIFLSARGSERDRVRGLSLGAHDYLAKPFSLQELYLRIARLLETRAQIERLVDIGERDVATGLSNRRRFEVRLRAHFAEEDAEAAMIFITLGNLDEITSRHGIEELDEVLWVAASAVDVALREGGEAFWVGGNHIAVLLPWGHAEAERTETELIAELKKALAEMPSAKRVFVESSLTERTPGEDVESFLKRATGRRRDSLEEMTEMGTVIPLKPFMERNAE